jgi:hypothetical protein
MFQTEIYYFVVLAVLILSTPFLPSRLLLLLDNLIVRLGMVILLLYFVNVGPTVGVFGLVAIAVLYLERNRRKVGVALKKLDQMDVHLPPQATIKEASTPQKTVPVASFDNPDHDLSSYIPDDESYDITNFEPVAPTINQKAVLTTVYPLASNQNGSAAASQHLYEKLGFGHLPNVETLGDSN